MPYRGDETTSVGTIILKTSTLLSDGRKEKGLWRGASSICKEQIKVRRTDGTEVTPKTRGQEALSGQRRVSEEKARV